MDIQLLVVIQLEHRSHDGHMTDPLSQLGGQVVEDEVRVYLEHGAHVGDVVSHHSVREGEGCRGAIGKVTHHQPIWMGRVTVHVRNVLLTLY